MKRVTFGSVDVWEMEDSEAHRQARKAKWMIYASDRFRFKRRIRECEIVLGPILACRQARSNGSVQHSQTAQVAQTSESEGRAGGTADG